jgi:hypothetical protein
MAKKKYAKVRAVIEYKVEVSDEFPLSLKDEKLQWQILTDRGCEVIKPKFTITEILD